MDLFSFGGWKKKALRFVVKSAIGRFLKGVDHHHVNVEPEYTAGSLKFSLQCLEVNEELINAEFLSDVPLRLAHGTVNEVSGSIAIFQGGARHTLIEGIDLTFDLIEINRDNGPAATEDEQRQQGRTSGGQHHSNYNSTTSRSSLSSRATSSSLHRSNVHNSLLSSVLPGDMSEETITNEILGGDISDDDDAEEGNRGGGGSAGGGDRTIDNGISAISQTIKGLVHSLSLTIKDVNVRIRCPPKGREIVPGAPLPHGTVELLISLPNEVLIADANTPVDAIGNSFRKRISFSGIRVSVYDATSSSIEDDGDVARQTVSSSDIVIGGLVNDVGNEVHLTFNDVLPESGAVPKWTTDVALHQLHAILGPSQLLRLSVFAQRLLEAPQVGESSGRRREEVRDDHSSLTVRAKALSLSILYDDAREMVGNAWRQFDTSPIDTSLRVRYYAARLYNPCFKSSNSSQSQSETDDKYHRVFDRYGGHSASFSLFGVEVVENRPEYAQLTLLSIGSRPKKSSTKTASSSSRAATPPAATAAALTEALRCTVRTTCPMTVSLARELGVNIAADFPSSVVRQDVFLKVAQGESGAVEMNMDVEVLERLIKFGKRLEYLVTKAAADQQSAEEREWAASQFKGEGEADDCSSDDGFHSMMGESAANSPLHNSRFGGDSQPFVPPSAATSTSAEGLSPGNAARRSASTKSDQPTHTVLRTASAVLPMIRVRVLFPMTRRPSRDLYGPLTQRLFRQVLEHSRASNGGISARSTSSRASSGRVSDKHWRKALVLEVAGIKLTMPTGDTSHMCIDGDKLAIVEQDTVTPQSTIVLCKADLVTPFQSGRSSHVRPKKGGGAGAKRVLFEPPHTLEIIRRDPPYLQLPSSAMPASLHQPQQAPLSNNPLGCYAPSNIEFRTDVAWEDTEKVETRVSGASDLVVHLHVPRLYALELHQDDLLLLLFMMGEVSDCVTDALKSLDPIQAEEEERRRVALGRQQSVEDLARHCQNGSFHNIAAAQAQAQASAAAYSPAFGASIRIVVGKTEGKLWVPRLGSDGMPIGEPLWMTVSKENQDRILKHDRKNFLYHCFTLEASSLGLFIYNYAPENADKHTSEMLVNIRASSIDLSEILPSVNNVQLKEFSPPSTSRKQPQWGCEVPLVKCYHGVYNRSHHVNNGAREPEALTVCLSRKMDVTGIKNDVRVVLDRLSYAHQTAFDGDNWLLALLQFVGDAPSAADVSDHDEDDDDDEFGEAYREANPPTITTSVFLVAKDSIVQYRPFGYVCLLVVLVPTLVVDTGKLVSTEKRSVISIGFDEATVYLTNEQKDDLFANATHHTQSRFGVTPEGGIAKDLENMGYVPILSVRSQQGPPGSAPHVYQAAVWKSNVNGGGGTTVTGTRSVRGTSSAVSRGNGGSEAGGHSAIMPEHYYRYLGGGHHSILADLPSPSIRIRSYDVMGKPVVVEVERLCVELACACDSFYLFHTVLSHYMGGVDLQYVPTPEALVGFIDGIGRKRQQNVEQNQPPRVSVTENYSEKIASVISKSIFDPDGLGSAAHDYEEYVTFGEDGQQVLSSDLRTVADAYELAEIFANHTKAPAAPVMSVDDDDDAFVVLDHAQGSRVAQRQPRQWSLNPLVEKSLSEGKNTVAAREAILRDMSRTNTGAAGGLGGLVGLSSVNNSAPNNTTTIPKPKPFDMTSIQVEHHFSLNNAYVCEGDDENAEADARLVGCPEVAAEVRVSDCVAIARFFGGLDFSGVRANAEYYDALIHTQSTAFFTGAANAQQSICYRYARKQNMSIEAQLFSISAQVDVFVPGMAKTMQMIFKVRDARIIDNIDTSQVRVILMCSIPAALRDNDGNIFEMKWVSTMANTAPDALTNGRKEAMEDISLRLQPLILNIHRRNVDLIIDFVNVSQDLLLDVLQIDATPSTMYFRRLFIHPISAAIYVTTEATEISKAILGQETSRGSYYEFANLLPSLEASKISLGKIEITNVHIDKLSERIVEALSEEMWSLRKIFLILCGFEIVRTVNEAGQAVAELVVRPLDYYRRNRSVYTGIVKGFAGFGKRLGAETMRVGASTARTAHLVVNSSANALPVRPLPQMPRGARPSGPSDGLTRAAREMRGGWEEAAEIVRFSLQDESGSAVGLSAAPLVIVDGFLRGIVQIFEGAQSGFRQDQRKLNNQLFKSK